MIAIRKYRKQMGMTQSALAKKCGVATTTVSMWEVGARKPDIMMLKKLAGIFGCTTDELLESQLMPDTPEPEQELIATLLSELRHKQAALATAEAQLAVQKAEAAIQRRAVADFIMLHPELMPYVTALPMEGS